MARIVILTGPPGAGKTTLAARLAAGSTRGVHVRGDTFFTFLAQPISPVLPESHAQNETVIRAAVRTAATFATGGYEVFLDGIFGPWFLPAIAEELAPTGLPVEYVVLRIDLARTRGQAPPGTPFDPLGSRLTPGGRTSQTGRKRPRRPRCCEKNRTIS
jgi:predicted kinase